MARQRILIVEDDRAIRQGLVDAPEFAGYDVVEAADGESGLLAATSGHLDLVLLDVLLPGRDGFSLLEELRARGREVPVIMLTARGEESDRVRGLRSGADDYVVKPFSADELLARVDAVLRRAPRRVQASRRFELEGRTVDLSLRCITFADGREVVLSERECDLLAYLMRHEGRCIPRQELLSAVWGLNPQGIRTRTVDMHIARLREHLGEAGFIRTIRSKGYLFVKDASADA